MNIIFLGPQGSGKGTQAKLLCEKFNLFYVSTGDILREIAKTNKQVEKDLKEGKLLPDEETFKIMTDYLSEHKVLDNVLFDGYPRTVAQFGLLDKWLKGRNQVVNLAVLLQISDKEAVRRLSARRMDSSTGAIYNLVTNPPGAGVNPDNLVQRADDMPDAIEKRLAQYHALTKPLVDLFKKEGILITVNGERPIDVIQKELVDEVEKLKNG